MITALITFLVAVCIVGLAGLVYALHNRIARLEEGRTIPVPKMIDGPRCAHCNKPVGPEAAEVSMSVRLLEDKEIPVTFKICQEHAA